MDNLITNVSVEEVTENDSDVSYLGVPTFASNNSFDNYDTNYGNMNFCYYIMAVMYNWFNVFLLNKMKYVFFFGTIFIVYLYIENSFDIDVNENYVFLALYIIDVRRELNVEIVESLDVAVVYFAYAGVDYAVNPVAYSILYVIIMNILYAEM